MTTYFNGSTVTSDTLVLSATDALTLPVGTTAQRPSTPVVGMIRFNSSNTLLEIYNGTTWAIA